MNKKENNIIFNPSINNNDRFQSCRHMNDMRVKVTKILTMLIALY